MNILSIGLLLAYVLLAPWALLSGSRALTPWLLGLLPLALLIIAWQRRSVWPLLFALLLSGLSAWLWRVGDPTLLLYLPPMLIHGFLAYLFGSTLRVGQEPLIVRFIRIVHGPAHPPTAAMFAYARSVTLIWASLFGLLLALELLLFCLILPEGLFAQLGLTWNASPFRGAHYALLAHGLSWLAMAALMGIEWWLRKRRFQDMPYRNFADFIKRVIQHSPRLVREWRHG